MVPRKDSAKGIRAGSPLDVVGSERSRFNVSFLSFDPVEQRWEFYLVS